MPNSSEQSEIAYAYLAAIAIREACHRCFTLYKLTQNQDVQILCDLCSHAKSKLRDSHFGCSQKRSLAGVTVSVLYHPEFGSTKTRSDGWFDLAVNGGGILVLDYQKPGYIRAQRKVDTPWRDFAIAEDVALIQFNNKATPITLDSDVWQVGKGTETNDARGKRTVTVLYHPPRRRYAYRRIRPLWTAQRSTQCDNL